MRHTILSVIALLLLLPLPGRAQGTVNELENDFGGRLSLALDKKIVKGVHLVADGEIRFSDNFSSLSRYQAGLGLNLKINKLLKVGAGYEFIEKLNSKEVWKPRHRFHVDGAVNLHTGPWQFGLKESLLLTHREVGNTYQNNPNLLSLKSRLKISYKGLVSLTPYGFVEVRNVFNDPSCIATWSTSSQVYTDYSFGGYNDAYINRIRGSLGVDWKFDKHNSLDFFFLTDYCYDKNIDVDTKDGVSTLSSLTYDQRLKYSLGIGYKLSF